MECIHCPQCYAYAYDTLIRPASRSRIDMFEKTINIPRIAKAAHTLRCVEAGGVVRPKNRKRDAFAIMWLWMQGRLTDLGNMAEIHFNHSGGFAPEPPPTPSALVPLRIRIPRCPDGLYD